MTSPTDCAAMAETKHTATTYHGYHGSVIDADHLNGIARKLRTVASVWTGDKEAREMADWCERAVNAHHDLRAQLAAKDAEIERLRSERNFYYDDAAKAWTKCETRRLAQEAAEAQLADATKRLWEAEDLMKSVTRWPDDPARRSLDMAQVRITYHTLRGFHAFLASNPTPEDAG